MILRHQRYLSWLVIFAMFFLFARPGLGQAKETTGKVTLIIGSARYYTGADKSPETIQSSLDNPRMWKNLAIRQELKAGDVVSVAGKSRLDLVFQSERLRLDGPTLFQINALSEVKESRSFLYFFKRQETKNVSKFKLFFGQVLAKVNKLRRQDVHSIDTPTAVMGVYGTSYQLRTTTAGKGDLSVMSGEVRIAFHHQPERQYSVFAGHQLKLAILKEEGVQIKPLPPETQQKLQEIILGIQETPFTGEILPPGGEPGDFTPPEGDQLPEGDLLELPQGDQGGAPPPTGDTQGNGFPGANNLNFTGGSLGTGHGPDNTNTPASATERKKIDVKLKLDWSNLKN